MTHPVLLVGVGGAGLNTLTAFNRQLAANPDMRPRMANEIYYLAVDTDRPSLEHFLTCVAHDAGAGPQPFVGIVDLSQGLNTIYEIVYPAFVKPFFGKPDNPRLARLREHWWFDADDNPFAGPRPCLPNTIRPVSAVEGYGLAWYQLIKLERDISDIIERIIPQIADGQLPNVDVFVVASLVGGTGRGAWAPIALKIKEVFKHCWNMNVRSTGILFDAGVFESVFQEIPPCERTLRVNSLTGLSELSAWLPPDGPGLSVDLPDMMRPDPKRLTDVLRTSIDAGAHAVNPVDTVYLVCGRSRDAFLDNPLQYEEMAGTALAAMLVHPIVRASRINQPDRYNSFAACQFAVDARGLNLYFNYLARTMAIDEFLSSDGDVEGVVDEYLRRFPMADAVRSVQDVQPLDNGTLLQRAALSLLALPRLQGDLKDLRERLLAARRGDVERIRKQVFLFVESVSDAEIQMAVKATVASGLTNRDGRISDPRAELESAFREASRANGGIPRFGFVRRFAERLLARIRETDESSLEEIRLPNQDGTILLLPEEWIDEEVRAFAQMTLADLLSHRGLFSDAEINQLDSPEQPCFEGDVPTAVVSAAYPRLRAAIKAFFRPAIALAESVIRCCDEIAPLFVTAKAAIRMDAIDGLGGDKNLDNPFNLVFATPDRMEDSLPDPESTEWHYNRILRPIATDEEEIRKLIREKRGRHVGFGDRLWNALRRDRQPPARGFDEEIVRIVREDIHSDGGLIEEFTFLKVLARNRPYWNARLLANDRISDRIRMVLGVEANDGVLPPTEVLVHTIAAKMCDSCLPWWRPKVETEKTEEQSVKAEKLAEEDNPTIDRIIDGTVFIPLTARADTSAIAERAFRRVRPIPSREEEKVQIRWNVVWSSERESISPFAVVSFIEEAAPEKARGKTGDREHPLDGILSFDYWKDPQVADLLREAERPDGALVFSDNLGYISPRFVRDPEVSAKRWKPWVERT